MLAGFDPPVGCAPQQSPAYVTAWQNVLNTKQYLDFFGRTGGSTDFHALRVGVLSA